MIDQARAILKRIHAIKNIAKITSTMEKIATARFKRAFDRAVAARPYTDRLTKLIEELTQAAGDYSHPLLEAREAKKMDGLMPTLFGHLPRLPYGIREIPAEIAPGTTTAYYNPGSPELGIAGTYYVNTSKLDQRPLWEVPALTVHEGVPGHHHQIAIQQELDMPEWRKRRAGLISARWFGASATR